jgi:hypothetical protein
VPGPLLHTVGGLIVLALALILAVYKPKGTVRSPTRQALAG